MEIIRDIFQHVPLPFIIAWWIFGAITAYLFVTGLRKHIRVWKQGKAEHIAGSPSARMKRLLYFGIAQAKVLSKRFNGTMHVLISIVGILLLLGMFFPVLGPIVGYLALLFGVGLILLEYKRLSATGPPLETAWEDSFVSGAMMAMTASGFLMMGINTWAWSSPTGGLFASLGSAARRSRTREERP